MKKHVVKTQKWNKKVQRPQNRFFIEPPPLGILVDSCGPVGPLGPWDPGPKGPTGPQAVPSKHLPRPTKRRVQICVEWTTAV